MGAGGAGRWLGAGALVVALVVAAMVVPAVLDGPPETAAPARAVEGSREAPSFELVQRLREEFADAAAGNDDFPFDPAVAAEVATSPQAYTPLGRIAAADIGLDVAYAAGVHPSVLERGPGHWPGTVAPGQPGNAVLSGHRTTHTRPFGELDRLTAGDEVVVTRADAAPVTYRVTETLIVPEAEYRDVVLTGSAEPGVRQLTLFACHPEGERTHRIVVRATA
jgi:sortase A